MMGKDLERIVSILNNLKDEASKQIEALSYVSDYRLATIKHVHNVRVNPQSPDAPHSHGSGTHTHDFMLQGNNPTGGEGNPNRVSDQLTYPEDYNNDKHGHHPHIEPYIVYEGEHPESAATYTGSIVSIGMDLQQDLIKMKQIEGNMYTESNKFNNEYGSPWKEIYMLKEKIDMIEKYASDFPELQWIGEKQTLLQLINVVLTYTVDTKWAVIYYQDYVQRGYDNQFNNNQPSIVWDDFNNKKTIGNRKQDYIENVHIKQPSADPF